MSVGQWWDIVRRTAVNGVLNRAFFHVNGVISVGLLVLVLVQLAVR